MTLLVSLKEFPHSQLIAEAKEKKRRIFEGFPDEINDALIPTDGLNMKDSCVGATLA